MGSGGAKRGSAPTPSRQALISVAWVLLLLLLGWWGAVLVGCRAVFYPLQGGWFGGWLRRVCVVWWGGCVRGWWCVGAGGWVLGGLGRRVGELLLGWLGCVGGAGCSQWPGGLAYRLAFDMERGHPLGPSVG